MGPLADALELGELEAGAAGDEEVDADDDEEEEEAGDDDELHPPITTAIAATTTAPAPMRARLSLNMVLAAPFEERPREPLHVEIFARLG